MSLLIAVTGKGGTGKTTASAFLVRLLVERGVKPVLAVDADPNSTLAPYLGVKADAMISDIRQEMMAEKVRVDGIPKERALDLKLQECIVEGAGFDLIAMGRPEGKECYCYVNNLLRHALASLKGGYRAVIVDNEAGMEHLSRMNTDTVDCLVTVSEPTIVSARSAARIVELAESLPMTVNRRVLAWTKVPEGGLRPEVTAVMSGKNFDATVQVPFSRQVAELAATEESVTGIPSPTGFEGLIDACIMNTP